MCEQERETQQITPEDCGSMEDVLGVNESGVCDTSKDIMQFDVAVPLMDTELYENDVAARGVDVQALAEKIKDAIVNVVESETNWGLEKSEVFDFTEDEDGVQYEAPFRIERIDFIEEEDNSDGE